MPAPVRGAFFLTEAEKNAEFQAENFKSFELEIEI